MMIKKSLKYFAISFFAILILILGQFLFKYYEDVFFKGFGTSAIIQLSLYASLTLVPIAFLLSLGISSALIVRSMYRLKKKFVLKKHIHKVVVSAAVLALLLFLYSNYIIPKVNIKFSVLLYDMRHTQSGEKINKSDIALFEDHYSHKTISEIRNDIDTIYSKATTSINETKANLQLARKSDLLYSRTFHTKAEHYLKFIKKMKVEIFERYAISVILFLIILTGVFIGYLLRNKRNYIHIIIMIVIGILYYVVLMLI